MNARVVISLFFAVSLFTGFKLAYTPHEFKGWFTEILILLLYFVWKEREDHFCRTFGFVCVTLLCTEIIDEFRMTNYRLTEHDYYYPIIGIIAIIASILYHYISNRYKQTKL